MHLFSLLFLFLSSVCVFSTLEQNVKIENSGKGIKFLEKEVVANGSTGFEVQIVQIP